MSDSKPLSPSAKPPPPSQTNSHSRSLTPRQEYTPSPPRWSPRNQYSRNHSPPRQKRHRSRSPDRSPLRKYPRRSRTNSRSPLPDRHDRYDRYDRLDDRHDRYHRHQLNHRSDRYDRYDRRDVRNRYHDRDSRRRYYSPEPRSPPPRYRDYSRDRDPTCAADRYRPRYRDDAYRDRDYDRRWSRFSDRSSSRSPRRRRDRRRRDRRRRDREPVSPSQRIPAEQVDQLFLEALRLVVRYRRPPFNISVISDYMSSINQSWSVRKTQYPTFSDLCRIQESRGHLVLARQGESVVMQSSKYQPDVLEVKPKDMGRRRRHRDRDRAQDDDDRIDASNRRDWDLDKRAEARKERFRENPDDRGMDTGAKLEQKHNTDQDIGEGATQMVPEDNLGEQDSPGLVEGGRDRAERPRNTDMNGLQAARVTTASKVDQSDPAQLHSSRSPPDAYSEIGQAGKTKKRIEKGKDDASETVHAGVSGNKANGGGDKAGERPNELMVKSQNRATDPVTELPAES